jgi:hypothetical protein
VRRFHLENGSVGGGVVPGTSAQRFIQLRSVSLVCTVEDRHEFAQLNYGGLDVLDSAVGSGPEQCTSSGWLTSRWSSADC